MWFVNVIALIVGGALAIPNLVLGKLPQAKDIMEKVTPFQSWIGIALLIWGVWDLISGLLISRWVYSWGALTTIIMIAIFVIEIALGIILSMNFLKQQKGLPQDKLEQLEKTIVQFQVPLGIGGIIAGLFILIRFTVLAMLMF